MRMGVACVWLCMCVAVCVRLCGCVGEGPVLTVPTTDLSPVPCPLSSAQVTWPEYVWEWLELSGDKTLIKFRCVMRVGVGVVGVVVSAALMLMRRKL